MRVPLNWLRLVAIVTALALLVRAQAEAIYELKDFTVKAWHFEKDILEVPADVTRLNREVIDRSLATSVPEFLESEANLYFTTLSGFTSVDVRGFGEGSGMRTLILIDGQPLNPGDMGRISWELIPLDAIESVEVLKGGQNVLYGDKALSGVIKIETRRSGEAGLSLNGRIGNFGSSRGSLSGSAGHGKWSIRAGASQSQADGYRENSTTESRDAYITTGYSFDNGDNFDLRLSVGESDAIYPGGLRFEDFRLNPRSSDKSGQEGAENTFAIFTARAEGSRDWGEWEVLAGYDYKKIDFVFEPLSFGRSEQDGFSLKPRVKFGERNVLILGSDFLYDTLEDADFLSAERRLIPSEADLSEQRLSPYFLLERRLSERVIVSGGARYEWVRYEVDNLTYVENQISPVVVTNRGTFSNPNFKNPPDIVEEESFSETIHEEGAAAELSINFKVNKSWSLFAGYDRVYRYPVFDERAAYQGLTLAEDVSPIEAEQGDNFELGVKYISEHHELYLTAYLLKMGNEIFYDPEAEGSNLDPAGDPIRGLNINLGPVDRHGADFLYRYSRKNWGFSFQISHVTTEMKSGIGKGKEVPLVPRFVTTSQAWWQPVEWLRLKLIHRYVDERFVGSDLENIERKLEAHQLVDFHAEAKVAPNYRVFLRIDNVFDELYAGTAFSSAYYAGNGRSLELGVKLDF